MNHLSDTQNPQAAPQLFSQILGQLEIAQKNTRRGRLVGISGCRPGDGATFVVDTLARDLVRSSRKRVLRVEAGSLLSAMTTHPTRLLSLCSPTAEPGLWEMRFGDEVDSPLGTDDPVIEAALAWLASQFQFVLLDLGAVTTSGQLWHFAPELDEVLLVVSAGQTKRSQITYAQRVIAQAQGKLTGCVLNRRTYPLPPAVFRFLN